MDQDKSRHADFVYSHFGTRFSKAGWYVVGRKDQEPWKPYHGPFSKDEVAKATSEFFKDLGRPFNFECKSGQLNAAGKITKLLD